MKEDSANLFKYILAGAIGFGVGGTMWGFGLYNPVPPYDSYSNPFTYGIGGIIIGAIGGASLALLSKNVKKMLIFALLGAIGLLIGFIIGVIVGYPLILLDAYLLEPLPQVWKNMSALEPSLIIGYAVLDFAIVGAIGGFFYGLALKKNIVSFTLSGAIGFGIGSLIGPVVGNLIGTAFNSLLAAYVIIFMIIGAIFGSFLGRCVYLAENPPSNPKEEMSE